MATNNSEKVKVLVMDQFQEQSFISSKAKAPQLMGPGNYEGTNLRNLAGLGDEIISAEEKAQQELQTEKQRYQELSAQAGSVLQALQTALADVEQEVADLKKSYVERVCEAAFIIAERLLEQELSLKPEFIQKQVQELLESVQSNKKQHIFINPKDLAYLEQAAAEGDSFLANHQQVRFEVDEQQQRGSCRLESERGSLEVNIFRQLECMRQELAGESMLSTDTNETQVNGESDGPAGD